MRDKKKDVIQFLTWMRNGTAFAVTWMLILVLLYCQMFRYQTIPANDLTKMLLLMVGGVFIFCLFFARLFFKKWSFIKRLTCFMILIALYECAGFYWVGIFTEKGTIAQWLIFFGIVFGLYGCCIAIYQRYSKKQGAIYTQALQKYQQQRSATDE